MSGEAQLRLNRRPPAVIAETFEAVKVKRELGALSVSVRYETVSL
jgi:hypothetical protein